VNALGINKGMPVKLHGFTIGSVNDMELATGGVDVRLVIGSEYLARIPQDSRARHARESGVIGASVIDIVPGKSQVAIAEDAQLALRSARPLMEHSEVAAREAGDVLGAAKRVWPLSDSFKETSDGMLPIDSFEAEGKGRSR